MLTRAWVWLGALEAALVTGGFFFVLLSRGLVTGRRRGQRHRTAHGLPGGHGDDVRGHHGVPGGHRVRRTDEPRVAALDRGFTNRLLLWGIAFELVFAAAVIYLPPLQELFHTAALGVPELAILATFPVLVWGSDELRRAWLRRRPEH